MIPFTSFTFLKISIVDFSVLNLSAYESVLSQHLHIILQEKFLVV